MREHKQTGNYGYCDFSYEAQKRPFDVPITVEWLFPIVYSGRHDPTLEDADVGLTRPM